MSDLEKILQESHLSYKKIHWIPYDNFQNIRHIADSEYARVYSAELKNDEHGCKGKKVALKEVIDPSRRASQFLKRVCL